MSTRAAEQFPTRGLRQLSPREALQRTAALACTLPQDGSPPCAGQVHVGIFFDGTGNNMEADFNRPPPERRKHSNVVRLFQAHRINEARGFFASYVPGVGAPFPEVGDTGEYWLVNRGSSSAAFGEARINWGFTQLLNTPHLFVLRSELIPRAQA